MRNIKTILVVVFAVLLFAALPVRVSAEEQVCTQVYGGGVVCGAATEHEPVDTAGLNPAALGILSLGAAGVFRFLSKKLKASILV